MVSPRAQKEWKFWSERARTDSANDVNKPKHVGDNSNTLTQDTVGAVALDTFGGLASGVSRSVKKISLNTGLSRVIQWGDTPEVTWKSWRSPV